MVTFTCEQCQWTGKKKQVEKHYNQCRSEWFSCVDCGKSFGDDYAKHTSCVQEDDKYHGKWAKSQMKQKNKANHDQVAKRKENGVEKSNSSNGAAKPEPTQKRKREPEAADVKDAAPATKKQKTEVSQVTATATATKTNGDNTTSAKKKKPVNHKKRLKQILKTKSTRTTLKSVYDKFIEQIDAEKDEAKDIFLQTLWKINDKVAIKL